jgi:hypothetical protein
MHLFHGCLLGRWTLDLKGNNSCDGIRSPAMAIGVGKSNISSTVGFSDHRARSNCWGVLVPNVEPTGSGSGDGDDVGGDGGDAGSELPPLTLPCKATVQVDCDTGTLSIGVEDQMPLTTIAHDLVTVRWNE